MAAGDSADGESPTKSTQIGPIIPKVIVSEPSSPREDMSESKEESTQESNGAVDKNRLVSCDYEEDAASFEGSLDQGAQMQIQEMDSASAFSLNYINEQGTGLAAELIPDPPDGGYGWVIVFAAFCCNLIVDGICNSFSEFKPAFSENFGISETTTAFIGSILVAVYLLVGPIAGGLVNNYGARTVAIAGAIIAAVGFAMSTYATSVYFFIPIYGILGGIGFGLIYLPSIVIVGFYFENKRAFATGVAVAGSGVGTIVMPMASEYLIKTLEWKGALFVMSGLILFLIPLSMLYRPLETTAQLQGDDGPKGDVEMELLKQKLNKFNDDDISLDDDNFGKRNANFKAKTSEWIDANNKTGPADEEDEAMARLRSALSEMEAAEGEDEETPEANGTATGEASPVAPSRTQLSPITEHVASRNTRATISQTNPPVTATQSRSRKMTLTSVNSDMYSTTDMRSIATGGSRANLNTGLARVSARSFATSLSRLSGKGTNSMLSVAMSGVDPQEFAKPMNRKDIFYTGSIHNLKEFKEENKNLQNYRESVLSIPASVVSRAASKMSNVGELSEIGTRIGGSRMSRFTGGFGPEDGDFLDTYYDDSKFKFIPLAIRNTLSEMVDLEMLKDPVMILLCLSNLFGMMAFYIPFVYLKSLAMEGGIEAGQAKYLVPMIGVTNTLGRVLFGILADLRYVSALSINNIGLIACGVLSVICPLLPGGFTGLAAYSALFGFFISAYISLTSIVLNDLMGLDKLTSAFGILVVSRGIAALIGTPFAGMVYDLTKSYAASFYCGGVMIIISGAISCFIPTVHRWKRSHGCNEGDEQKDEDAISGKLSVLTERSEENLTEYQRTIQSLRQQHALLREIEEEKKKLGRKNNDDRRDTIGEAEEESDEVDPEATQLLEKEKGDESSPAPIDSAPAVVSFS